MENKKWKGTTGEPEILGNHYFVGLKNQPGLVGKFDSSVFTFGQQKANAELFADALTTIQQCDMMPSLLLQIVEHDKDIKKDYEHACMVKNSTIKSLKSQRDELLEILREVAQHYCNEDELARVEELISKIKRT